MSSKKTWKEHFLSSGIPLEYSVAEVFHGLTRRQPKEFSYERQDEQGVTRVFSVDVHSTNLNIDRRSLRVETLVECNHRHDGTKWVFTPDDYDFFGASFSELFVTLDECCADRRLNMSFLDDVSGSYPLCTKGIELLRDNSNPKAIQEAVQQLRYGVTARAIDAINHQITLVNHPIGIGDPTPIFIILPIIVTTAELWRLKPGTTVDDVRKADEITDVATSHDTVVLLQKPDNLDRKHTTLIFETNLDGDYRKQLDNFLRMKNLDPLGFVDTFASRIPSLFIVIRYDSLRSVMTDLFNIFKQDEIISLRTLPSS